AEDERVGIGRAERVVDEMVVALGHHGGPAADNLDAVAAAPEVWRRALVRQEMREGGDARWGHEVTREAVPVVAVGLAQERHEAPAVLKPHLAARARVVASQPSSCG